MLFQSGTLSLPPQGNVLIAAIPNLSAGADTVERPFELVFLSGSGSTTVLDKDTNSTFRLVNASPGTYNLDVFLNASTVDATARQTCDPLTTEAGTFLELCAVPYTSVGGFNTIDPGSFYVKIQKTDDAAVAAESLLDSVAAGAASTAVLTGLIADTATTTTIGLHPVLGGRRIATAAQLRLVDVSLAGNAAIAGDPTTDQLAVYITEPGASLAGETADFSGFQFGSDSGYVSMVADNYQVTVAIVDTATPDAPPQILLTEEVALADSGIYTLLIADSTGGVQPLQYLSIDDDPFPPP